MTVFGQTHHELGFLTKPTELTSAEYSELNVEILLTLAKKPETNPKITKYTLVYGFEAQTGYLPKTFFSVS